MFKKIKRAAPFLLLITPSLLSSFWHGVGVDSDGIINEYNRYSAVSAMQFLIAVFLVFAIQHVADVNSRGDSWIKFSTLIAVYVALYLFIFGAFGAAIHVTQIYSTASFWGVDLVNTLSVASLGFLTFLNQKDYGSKR